MDSRDAALAHLIDRVAHARTAEQPVEICGGGTKRL